MAPTATGRQMPKAILILLGFVAIGVGVLHFRQQSFSLRYRAAKAHKDIQAANATLWQQQVRIAEFVSPKTILPAPLDPKKASEKDVAGARE